MLAAWWVDDQMHPACSDRVLVPAANAHRGTNDLELRISEAEGDGAQRTLGAVLHIAVPAHHVVAVRGDPDRRPA